MSTTYEWIGQYTEKCPSRDDDESREFAFTTCLGVTHPSKSRVGLMFLAEPAEVLTALVVLRAMCPAEKVVKAETGWEYTAGEFLAEVRGMPMREGNCL